jgi:hypothetical protein
MSSQSLIVFDFKILKSVFMVGVLLLKTRAYKIRSQIETTIIYDYLGID